MDSEGPILQRTFVRTDGPVAVEIFRPKPDPKPGIDGDPNDPSWKCRYKIVYPDGHVTDRGVFGVDGIQAMLLTLSTVKGDLKRSEPPVSWLDDEDLGLYITDYE